MKQITDKKLTWENELEALRNMVTNLNLTGLEVFVNHNGGRKNPTYFLRDETGNTITGSWTYLNLNHFIMGYGTALKAAPITPVNEGQQPVSHWEFDENGDNVIVSEPSAPVQGEGFTDEQIQHNFMLYNWELFQMVRDLKDCIKRLSQDNLSQFERDNEAQWEGDAHELLSRINPNYYKNANE